MERPFLASNKDSAPFWQGLNQREIRVPKCNICHRIFFYPRSICPFCSGDDLEWVKLSGRGRVYSFTVIRRSANPAFQAMTPYLYAMIDLAEGVRLATNIINCELDEIEIGMPVRAVFVPTSSQQTIALFEPDK